MVFDLMKIITLLAFGIMCIVSKSGVTLLPTVLILQNT